VSAINQHTSRIDRAGELRVNQETLDQLWQRAQILQLAEGRIAAVDTALTLISAQDVAAHIAADTFTEGSRYFLGLDLETKAPFFAWDTEWVGTIADEVRGRILHCARDWLTAERTRVRDFISCHGAK